MFSAAILIGIYSYIVFSLGLVGVLFPEVIFFVTIFFFFVVAYLYKRTIIHFFSSIRFNISVSFQSLVLLLVITQSIVNLAGALGPELGFDALWYHLTIPKIFLLNHAVFHIPGNLFYYSDMPKLAEMLYVSGLALGDEHVAKTIHFLFGIGALFATYVLSKELVSKKLAVVSVLILSSCLVFAWESITAYVDLARTFFELLALYSFILFYKTNSKMNLWMSAVMLGLAVATKLLAIGSLVIFAALLLYVRHNIRKTVKDISIFILIALLIPFPWFLFSFLNTGNPVYPFFTNLYQVGTPFEIENPIFALREFGKLFLFSQDPVSPVYTLFFPFFVIFFKKFSRLQKIIVLYCLIALFVWYLTPRTGGGRFVLPYLPALSVLCVCLLEKVTSKFIKKGLLFAVILISIISITYRAAANARYIPVLAGLESKQKFLQMNLNFSYGDFYDINGAIAKILDSDDRVLIYGGHNLYYVSFPFVHESFVKKGDAFNYILTVDSRLPDRFSYWRKIYENGITKSSLYTHKKQEWIY